MIRVANLVQWLDQFAPPTFAESWDNVGLLAGDPQQTVNRIMTCLTVTPESCAEAVAEEVELVVTHHPILFRPIQKLRADRPDTALVWQLARAGISVYAPHPAFDNTQDGINAWLATALALPQVEPLPRFRGARAFKLVVFCTAEDREQVLAAAFAAGAGTIGNYGECSFSSRGLGTFFGTEGANPAVGQKGRREQVREWRCELRVPEGKLTAVLQAIRKQHSYEEPAIDVYPLEAPELEQGVGRVGQLTQPVCLSELAQRVAGQVGAQATQIIGLASREVQRVALVCGAGDSFISQAKAAGADVLITGEVRFHQALEARAAGLGLIAVGHHSSERPAVEMLAHRLQAAFPTLKVWASLQESDPIWHLVTETNKKPPA